MKGQKISIHLRQRKSHGKLELIHIEGEVIESDLNQTQLAELLLETEMAINTSSVRAWIFMKGG